MRTRAWGRWRGCGALVLPLLCEAILLKTSRQHPGLSQSVRARDMTTPSLASALSVYMRGATPTTRAVALVREQSNPPLETAARAAGRARGGGRGTKSGRRGASCGRALEVGELRPVPKRRRLSYDVGAREALGQQAFAFRQEFVAEHGHARGVWLAFQERLLEEGGDSSGGVPAVEAVRQAFRVEARRDPADKGVGQAKGARRRRGGGRIGASAELGEELWHWFVDRINTVQARITSSLLLAQAEAIRRDLIELHYLKVEQGRADSATPPRLPQLDKVWVRRWRASFGISFRTVNLRYKVSAAKRDSRLRINWCNTLRLRVLHRALFGEDRLRFVGLDQKPLWFNTSHASKTLALRGAARVSVKENTAASRERFTILTNVLSWTPTRSARLELRPRPERAAPQLAQAGAVAEDGLARAGPEAGDRLARAGPNVEDGPARAGPGAAEMAPPIAVLFRAGSGASGVQMRKRLKVPADTLLQFAPKGSYRLGNMLEYFEWAFAPAPHPRDSLVFVLDWYAVHLDEEVDKLLHKMGHAVLRIGGGITGDVQVGDTHRHGPYTKAYREREVDDAMRQQSVRPGRLPATSRQSVLDRAVAAWRDLDHSRGRREWVEDGLMGALDGSEDGLLRRDLQAVWVRLGMPAWRERIIQEIEAAVHQGVVTEWSQYPSILERYDDHDGMREGEESAIPLVAEMAEGDADAGESEDAPDDILAEAGEAGETAAPSKEEVALAPGAAAAEPAALGLLLAGVEARARADLAKDVSAARLLALSDAAASLRPHDPGAAEILENRLANLQRKSKDLSAEARVWLRGRALQRQDEEAAARAAAAAEDRESDRLVVELKVARAQEVAARSAAIGERAETKRALAKLCTQRDLSRQEVAYEKQRRELLRVNFVDWKLGQARAWFQQPEFGPERRSACAALLLRNRKKLGAMPPAPVPWSAKDRDGYLEITPGHLLLFDRPKRGQMDFASEALARRLYGGRHPKEATSAKSPAVRATAMLEECLPGFNLHFPAFMLLGQTLRAHQGNMDLAMFEVLWRFSHGVTTTGWPSGFLAWPMGPADINAFLRAQGRSDLEVPATPPKAAAAASASRRAQPPPAPEAGGGASSSSRSGAGALGAAAKAASVAFVKAIAEVKKAPPPARLEPALAPPPPSPKASAKGLAGKWQDPP